LHPFLFIFYELYHTSFIQKIKGFHKPENLISVLYFLALVFRILYN